MEKECIHTCTEEWACVCFQEEGTSFSVFKCTLLAFIHTDKCMCTYTQSHTLTYSTYTVGRTADLGGDRKLGSARLWQIRSQNLEKWEDIALVSEKFVRTSVCLILNNKQSCWRVLWKVSELPWLIFLVGTTLLCQNTFPYQTLGRH